MLSRASQISRCWIRNLRWGGAITIYSSQSRVWRVGLITSHKVGIFIADFRWNTIKLLNYPSMYFRSMWFLSPLPSSNSLASSALLSRPFLPLLLPLSPPSCSGLPFISLFHSNHERIFSTSSLLIVMLYIYGSFVSLCILGIRLMPCDFF